MAKRFSKGSIGVGRIQTRQGIFNEGYNAELDPRERQGKSSTLYTSGVAAGGTRTGRKEKRDGLLYTLLSYITECFCPLYSIQRDFVDYMHTAALINKPRHVGKYSTVNGGDFAEDMNYNDAYKGCYFFDNLEFDGVLRG